MVQLLIEQPTEACRWNCLDIFHVFRSACIFDSDPVYNVTSSISVIANMLIYILDNGRGLKMSEGVCIYVYIKIHTHIHI